MATDQNVLGAESLSADINKAKSSDTPENKEGIASEKLPELTLEMDDDALVKLLEEYEKDWNSSPKKEEWEKQIEENEKYWLGKQYSGPKDKKDRPMVDNIIFESLETYLPQATRRNPDPMVTLDPTEKPDEENVDPVKEKWAEKVKARLADLADKNKLRLKLKKGARHWAIYQLGVAKFGWDLDKSIPTVMVLRPKRIILDPDATIDEDGYKGTRIGEYRKMEASKIVTIIGEVPDQTNPETQEVKKGNGDVIKYIKDHVKDEMATEIIFQEWWTPEYFCWKLGKKILFKKKNPHWNYDTTIQPPPPEQLEQNIASETVKVDEVGQMSAEPVEVKGINHFSVPEMPYSFLSIFNLGDRPVDNTSLIGQNLSNQDRINKRDRQIDKNADRMNGGLVVSLARAGLTKAQAEGVAKALRKGGVVAIPDGAPREAIEQYSPTGLPNDVYNDRNDTRERVRDIFGVRGSSQAGLQAEDTVRGKIISRGTDTDRIGGGVTEYLEQWADDWYNWLVQLLYVYDPDFMPIEGGVPPKIVVSVKEGSLLPKDSVTIANQALELAKMNRISNLDLYKRLEWPNPEEVAANVYLEVNAPELLYKNNPMVAQVVAMKAAAAQAQAQAETETKNNDTMIKHANDVEKETIKSELKGRELGRLKDVPVK